MDLRFEHTEFLFAMAAIPVLVFLFLLLLKWKKSVAARIGEPKLVNTLIRNYSPLFFKLKFIVILVGLSAVILAAANLQKPGSGENVFRNGVDIMLVLDVSKSMLAEDYKPNRQERAKQFLGRLLDRLPDDRLGLVLFAGHAYMQMPLTTDQSAARLFLQSASPATVPTQGTAIGEALKMANSGFNSKEKKFKSVILITDGEDHDVDAMQVAKNLADNGVMINTVGIGSAEGTVIIDPETGATKKDAEGNTVITRLNESILQQLARTSNGIYVKLDDVDDAVSKITTQLNSIGQKALRDMSYLNYRTFFQWFVGAAILLLMMEFFIPERKKIKD